MEQQNNKPRLDIMMDLETLGTEKGCIVLSIGMRDFDIDGSSRRTLAFTVDRHISVISSLWHHLLSDYSTEEWWLGQKREARETIIRGQQIAEDIEDVMLGLHGQLTELQKTHDVYFWGRGVGSFDMPILDEAMRRVWEYRHPGTEYRSPLPFHHAMDVRSIQNFCRLMGMKVEKVDTPHTAMGDVEKQIKEVQQCTEFITSMETQLRKQAERPADSGKDDCMF